MSFFQLAIILAVAIAGTAVVTRRRVSMPVVVGELGMGVLLGATGFGILDANREEFKFLAEIGFILLMFVAGTHVPSFATLDKHDLKTGIFRAFLVAVVSVPLGVALSKFFGTGHSALYAVLITSSSAALILSALGNYPLDGPSMRQMIPQIALADAFSIPVLPLVLRPDKLLHTALGALAIIACAVVLYVVLKYLVNNGYEQRFRTWSKAKEMVLELRISLVIILLLGALAQTTGVSVMLAGFAAGLAVGAVGEPKRLAKQMFTLSEGLFAPIFFVWFGASLNLRQLVEHPHMIILGITLGAAAFLAHIVPVLTGQPLTIALMTAVEMGVPVAAATTGNQLGVLHPGEDAALMLSALITVAVTTVVATPVERVIQRESAAMTSKKVTHKRT
ncbi:cation:proton antiporter [Corynebacterium sp. 4HC-13]|uniref:cation:proton antiporter n=1 Tax=Corynebacterium anserum TaxID=2684406 RepID=UPI00163A573E|nr:cation:proton antiporter [Corynebacterium anserum]MBC2681508.1 cation:proton antiporter [Corynebacterium anserum]